MKCNLQGNHIFINLLMYTFKTPLYAARCSLMLNLSYTSRRVPSCFFIPFIVKSTFYKISVLSEIKIGWVHGERREHWAVFDYGLISTLIILFLFIFIRSSSCKFHLIFIHSWLLVWTMYIKVVLKKSEFLGGFVSLK